MSASILESMPHWQTWIGRSEKISEVLDPASLRRYAAAVGDDLDVERVAPALGHWAFFLPVAAGAALGVDGHPARGALLPPVSLPRRMFAAAAINWEAPLLLQELATLTSTVVDVKHRAGRAGDLVFVDVQRQIEQRGRPCVSERQTLVYTQDREPLAVVNDLTAPTGDGEALWRPEPVDLFRFSAATFNSHRIHYDLTYARDVEHYPGLVVQGPLVAARLYRYAATREGRAPRTFSFRALAPLFASQTVRLAPGIGGEVHAVRCDGGVAMTATV